MVNERTWKYLLLYLTTFVYSQRSIAETATSLLNDFVTKALRQALTRAFK